VAPKLSIPSSLTPFFYRAARDRFQRWLGYRGTPLERAIILRDLVEAGLLTANEAGKFTLATSLQSSSGHKSTLDGHQTPDTPGDPVTRLIDICGFVATGKKPVMIMCSFNAYWQDFNVAYFELRRYDDADASAGYTLVKNWGTTTTPYYYVAQDTERMSFTMVAKDEPPAGRWRYEIYLIGTTAPTTSDWCIWDTAKADPDFQITADGKSFGAAGGANFKSMLGTAGVTGSGKYYYETEMNFDCNHAPSHAFLGGAVGVATERDTYTNTSVFHSDAGAGQGLGWANGYHSDFNCRAFLLPNQFRLVGWDGVDGWGGGDVALSVASWRNNGILDICPEPTCGFPVYSGNCFDRNLHTTPTHTDATFPGECCTHFYYASQPKTYSRIGVLLNLDAATLTWEHLNGNYGCGGYIGIDTTATWFPAVMAEHNIPDSGGPTVKCETRFGEDGWWRVGGIPAGYSPFLATIASAPHHGIHNASTFAIEIG
jgi:hypothetical protein